MDLRLTDDQRAVQEAFAAFFAKEASPERVRAAEPLGFDPACWARLGELGAVGMGVGETSGGGGASLLDLALAVEPAGATIAPVPLVEAIVAARALEAAGPVAAEALEQVVDGTALIVLAPAPAVGGIARLVPGGAVADAVIALDGDELVLVRSPAPTAPVNLAVQPLADRPLADGRTVLATGAAATAAFGTALDEWRVLSASFAAGLGRRALDIGVEYVKERHQFGVPIGSFQTVAHRLADVATAVDGAELLARKAVWAAQTGREDASALAAMAFAFCSRTAFDAASWSLHYHGGYGFMLEYDVTLLLRRAKALQLTLGDPRHELAVVASRLLGPAEDAPPSASAAPAEPRPGAPTGSLDFLLGEASDEFRAEVRTFLDEHLTPDIVARAHETGTMHDWGLHRKLAERGWLSASWPVEVGGQGRDPLQMIALSEELYLRGAPIDGMGIASMVAHTLVHEGTDEQKRDILPGIIGGELMLCLGYSEPDAGSDVAAVATRAVRDGDEWVINGQKMFTTMAHEAHFAFLLVRTNLDVPKHKGLTMFLVPMDSPGIEITPVETLGGERTNITFYTDVRVPDAARVGEVDGGWRVMMTALVFERNAANWGESVRLLDRAVAWAAEARTPDGRRVIDDPINRERLARHAIGNEVARLHGYRAAWLAARGEMPAVEGSMAKLWTSEVFQAAAAELVDMLGVAGQLGHVEGAPADGWIEHAFRHSQVTTIYGGSSEIQRGIIAERGLHLPRSR